MSSSSLYSKGQKREGGKETYRSLGFFISSERVGDFSLRSRAIGPSDFVRTRRKVVLRSEGNAWAPVSQSFDNLREVRVLSYFSYTLFKCFVNVSVSLRP